MQRHALTAIVAAVLATVASPAHAGDNDLVLSRLGIEQPNGMDIDVIGDNQGFRSMVSELGVVLAPRLLSPSDTLGFGGFQFTADLGFTTVGTDQEYWRVLESSDNSPDSASHGSSIMPTIGLFMRKGIWLPLPSFEVGAGAVHLMNSRMWGAQVYAKFALHEGYHGLPLPSLAVRGAASRMMGTAQIDLTVASVDASISKAFGISGSINLEPYAGYNWLIIVPRSEVVDHTPHIADDREQNFTFVDQDNILRNRIFAGFKLQYYVFALLFEFDYALAGASIDDQAGVDMDCAGAGSTTARCDATDQAGAQQTYTVSLGLDF